MDKIKEKPQTVSGIREKVKAAPKELAHRGLEDGTNRLRTGLRDAAQQGRQDDYGGDRIEDTAADGMYRLGHGAEKRIWEKRNNCTSGDSAPVEPAAGDVPEVHTWELKSRTKPAVTGQPAEPVGSTGQRIKSKDTYLHAQAETPVSGLSPEHSQGDSSFILHRGRTAAKDRTRLRADRRKQISAPSGNVFGHTQSHTPAGIASQGQGMAVKQAAKGRREKPLPRTKPKMQPWSQTIKTMHRSPSVQQASSVVQAKNRAQATWQAASGAYRLSRAKAAARKAGTRTGRVLRAIYAALRSQIAFMSAGGAVIMSLLLFICLFGLLAASPFGILFTGEPIGAGTVSLGTAIAQIQREYAARLAELQSGTHDKVLLQGAPPDWREVVTVFAVRTAGAEDGVDVVTLDADRVGRLRAVFWDMTELSAAGESIDHPDSDPDDEEDDSWSEIILTIRRLNAMYFLEALANSHISIIFSCETSLKGLKVFRVASGSTWICLALIQRFGHSITYCIGVLCTCSACSSCAFSNIFNINL